MLRSLHIENYVLIDSLDADFPEGLVIITGQTGAGKSILLGALSLLTGARAEVSMIAAGASSCVVEGEFRVDDPSVREILEQEDVEWNDGLLVVRRVIHSSGRSRCFVNDSPVNVTLLCNLAVHLVDIHSQHQSLLLSSKKFQLSLLDSFAGVDAAGLSAAWSSYQSLSREVDAAREQLSRLDSEREYNQAQYDQLCSAQLSSLTEIEDLEQEQKALSNAEEIKLSLCNAAALFSPDFGGAEAIDLCASLKEAGKLLDKVSRFMPSVSDLSQRVESSRLELEDIRASIDDLALSVNLSSGRLQEVDSRLSLLYSLLQKHSCRTVSELIALREQYSSALFDSSTLESRIDELSRLRDAARARFESLSAEASSLRHSSADKLSASILDDLCFMDLDSAQFKLSVSSGPEGPSGTDSVSFLFSSNGTAPVDVSKCASGGEISRIMLSLKAMMARYALMPTMIFDEIDTGVSGSSADKMGQMICRMGDSMQVFAITHLPQVAAKGSAHYLVSKESVDGRMVSTITKLEPEARVQEIARLLSGTSITPEAIANAKSLLGSK